MRKVDAYLIDSDILVLSGTSGVGKSAICTVLKTKEVKGRRVEVIRSVTNRERRSHNDDYYFVSNEEFNYMVETGQFLEYNASYSNHGYGTPLADIQRCITSSSNTIPCLEIDRTGLEKILREGKVNPLRVHSAFIIAPASVVADRLLQRATETKAEIVRRLRISMEEIKHLDLYDAVIVNNHIDDTVENVLRAFEGSAICFDFDIEKYCHEMDQIIRQLEEEV